MQHYAASTCKSISDTPEALAMWRDTVPELALKYGFLMSAVLSVTALHLAILNPSEVVPGLSKIVTNSY